MVFKLIESSSNYSDLNVQPIFCVINEVVFSLNSNSKWIKITPSGKEGFEEGVYNMTLLTLLEIPYLELRKNVINILKKKNIDLALVDSFPFHLAILSAFKSGSEYWIQLALEWLKVNHAFFDKSIVDLLMGIRNNKQYSQKIRHSIIKMNKD